MAKSLRLSFLFLLLLSLSSCFKYEEVTIERVKSVKLLEFSDKGLVVESEIQITNPNNYKLGVVDSEFDVYVKGKRLAKARIDNELSIPKNSSEYHTVVMRSDYEDFADGALMNMLAITMGGNKIKFKVDGYIVGKAFLMRKKVKISHEEEVPLKLF